MIINTVDLLVLVPGIVASGTHGFELDAIQSATTETVSQRENNLAPKLTLRHRET